MSTTEIEAHFVRPGTSGSVSSAVAITLVPPAVAVSASNQIAGSSDAFCRLTETNDQATLQIRPEARNPGPEFPVSAAVLNRYGSLHKRGGGNMCTKTVS